MQAAPETTSPEITENLYMRTAMLFLGYAHVEEGVGLVIDGSPRGPEQTLELLDTYMELWEQAKACNALAKMAAQDAVDTGCHFAQQRDAMRSFIAAGGTFDELASLLDESVTTVLGWLAFRPDGDPEKYDVALAALRSGEVDTYAALATALGLHPATIASIANMIGVKSDKLYGAKSSSAVRDRVRELYVLWPRQQKRILETVREEFGEEASTLTYAAVNQIGRRLIARTRPADNRPAGHPARDVLAIGREASPV